ncbi:MAG TPA: hypothetical protein PK916_13300 [Bacteroidota bacterium]|nr:hypothetical protein [Bacteroidota bacterium]
MKRLLPVLLTLILAGTATAQPEVIVHLRNGMEVEGQLGRMADDTIQLIENRRVYYPEKKYIASTHSIAVSSIDRVEFDRVTVGSATLTGFGIGAGAGVLGALIVPTGDGMFAGLAKAFVLVSGVVTGTVIGFLAGLFSAEDEVVYHPEQPHDAAALAVLGAGIRDRGVVDTAHTGASGGASLTQYLREYAPPFMLTTTGGEIIDLRFIAVDQRGAHFLPEYPIRWLPTRHDGSIILPLSDIAEVESGDRPNLVTSLMVGAAIGALLTPSAEEKFDKQQMLGMGVGALCGLGVHSMRKKNQAPPLRWKRGDDPAILQRQSLHHLRPDIRWEGLEAAAP